MLEDMEQPQTAKMSLIGSLVSRILNRISKILDEKRGTEQSGFRKTFSTIDHIVIIL